MKRLLIFIGLAALAASLLLGIRLFQPPSTSSRSAEVQFGAFPIGVPQTIDFGRYPSETGVDSAVQFREASYWNGYSKESTGLREQLDQWRDWLLLTIVSSSNLSSAEINQVLFDLPPVRRSVLQAVANFEYSVTRSRVVGQNEVIALLPAGTPADSMMHLAHIADEQRKNLGLIPSRFHVFEYAISPEKRSAAIVRRSTLDGKELFGESGRYYERTMSSLQDLEDFLAHANDVTYASFAGGKLRIGGRRVPEYRGIRDEDVAAIWQSEQGGSTGFRGSGFSLDPQLDLEAIRRDKERLLFILMVLGKFSGEPMDAASVQELRDKLSAGDIDAYLKAVKEVCGNSAKKTKCQRIAKQALLENRFQKARYDGSLKGTEAGMVLFYTDLLMKLWSFDYQSSTPRAGQVDDFPNELKMSVARVYADEVERFPGTRLWLGSLDKGFQIGPDRREILLARNATRVFAVPHDFLNNKDVEESAEPHIYDRIFMTWWNQHYEEVAQYEKEYQRLNEIMKWSQIIGWLNTRSDGSTLGFLNQYPVKRDNWFPDWVNQHKELTFHDWKSIGFYGHSYHGSETEALPILKSKPFDHFGEQDFWEGGVSLARREAIASRSALTEDFGALARRGNIDYSASDLAAGHLRTLDKVEYQMMEAKAGRFSTLAKPDPAQRLRGLIGEFRGTSFERSVVRDAGNAVMSVRSGDVPLGDLRIQHIEGGFRVDWMARDVDAGQVLARKVSFAGDAEAALRNDESVAMYVKSVNDTYLVKPKGTDSWVKLHISPSQDSALAEGFDARISALGKDSKDVDVAWLKQADIPSQLPRDGFVQFPSANGTQGGKSLTVVARPPSGARSMDAEYLGRKIELRIDDASGQVFAPLDKLPDELRISPDRLRLLAKSGKLDPQALREVDLAHDFEAGNFRKLADQLTQDPESVRHALDRSLRSQLDEALVELKSGSADRAVDLARSLQKQPMRDSSLFLDEINVRIRNNSNTLEQENLEQLRSYVQWTSEHNGARLTSQAKLSPKSQGRRFIAEYDAVHLPSQPANVVDLYKSSTSLIYIQDSPGLNNLDIFTPSGRRSLESMVQSGRVSVRKASAADLAHYRPGAILEGESKTSLRLTESHPSSDLHPPHVTTQQSGQDCNGSDSRGNGCVDAYLISESPVKRASP